jgi:hypothetical protein
MGAAKGYSEHELIVMLLTTSFDFAYFETVKGLFENYIDTSPCPGLT